MRYCNFTNYRRIRQLSLVVLLLFFVQQNAYAAMSKAQIKAAYLYQFSKFSEWENPSEILVIGIVGAKETTASFNTINGKNVAGKRIKVRWILTQEELQDCCSVVFFANDKKDQFEHFYSAVSNKPVLTVLDYEYDASHKGMIRFVQKGVKLKFSVDNTLARSQSIKLSTFLLQVAILVE